MLRVDALGPGRTRWKAFSGDLLDPRRDAVLDEIVRRACEATRSPIALVSLVLDHIQFFRAHHGLPEALAEVCATPRDESLCQFVVRDGRPLVEEDAANNPALPQQLVREYGIRAYAGMPLCVRGTAVGTLCVIDTHPRAFTEDERDVVPE